MSRKRKGDTREVEKSASRAVLSSPRGDRSGIHEVVSHWTGVPVSSSHARDRTAKLVMEERSHNQSRRPRRSRCRR
ncbi:MAG: hypothetical protein U0894_10125 [Pirellulales bacterium]